MKIDSIAELKQAMIQLERELLRPEPIEGSTLEEIEQVKIQQGVSFLPELYRQFLLEMGHSAGHLYVGSEYTISELLEMKQYLQERIRRDGNPFQLPDDAFVFFMHGGYDFLYFYTADQSQNPPVYRYVSGGGATFLQYRSLLDHYSGWFNSLLKLREEEERRKQERRQQRANQNLNSDENS